MTNVHEQTIGFIGFGNMARAIYNGLVNNHYDKNKLFFSKTNPDNLKIISQSEIILLCVKPNKMADVLNYCSEQLTNSNKIIISVAAGLPIEFFENYLGPDSTIIRAMPNTPATIGLGITGLFTKNNLDKNTKKQINFIFNQCGQASWVNHESQIDIVTALSGSGPAYCFYFMESLIEQAQELGLPADIAKQFALQTFLGAAELAKQSNLDLNTLRKNVTSPNGTTEAGIKELENTQTKSNIKLALEKAFQRAQHIAKENVCQHP